ncbi:MAG: hypothetical protein OEY59_04190 [Deltaproteobacteria bacterium]|nr:hypothetical protein [Deltaproteobacteria bacterium]
MKKSIGTLLMILLIILVVSCGGEKSNSCVTDKKNEEWQKIVDNPDCDAEQKGEAYLALGGFNYIDFIIKSTETSGVDLITLLGLTKSNWSEKYQNFDMALKTVSQTYKTGSNTEQTVALFASFLSLYTYLQGNLDNGAAAGTQAFDGTIAPEEVSNFTGVAINDNQGSDGTSLVTTKLYQIRYNNQYYIIDNELSPPKVFNDVSEDGLSDSELTALESLLIMQDMANWTELNQVVLMDALDNPLSSQGDPQVVLDFVSNLLNYLTSITDSMISLGVDSTDDTVKDISKLKSDLDNGGACPALDNNPSLRLVELFSTNSKKLQLPAGESYATHNLFSLADLASLGEDSTFDSIPGTSVDPGVKMLFKKSDIEYIPYWDDATLQIKDAMAGLEVFKTSSVKKNDGIIAFSEIICAADIMSK